MSDALFAHRLVPAPVPSRQGLHHVPVVLAQNLAYAREHGGQHCRTRALHPVEVRGVGLGVRQERFFNKLKQFRRIGTRYEKLAANYLAMIKLATIRIWLRANESTP